MVWILAYHLHADTAGVQAMGSSLVTGAHSMGGLGRLVVQAGYQGVGLFLFASGAALAMAHARRSEPPLAFYRRRAARLLPPYYLAVALTVAATWALATWSRPMLDGVPYHPGPASLVAAVTLVGRLWSVPLSQSPPPSAWFVVLIAQLYLLFPLLWRARLRLGGAGLAVVALAVTVVSRESVHLVLAGLVHRPQDETYWLSILAPARLFEFAAGVAAAPWLARLSPRSLAWLAAPGLVAWLAGSAMEGGALSPVSTSLIVAGAAAAGASVATLVGAVPLVGPGLRWVGRRSLEVFLVQDVVRLALGTWIDSGHRVAWGPGSFAVFLVAVAALAAGFARTLRWGWLGRLSAGVAVGDRHPAVLAERL